MEIKNNQEKTALFLSVEQSLPLITRILLENQANIN